MIIIYILHNNKFIFTSLFSIKDAKKFKFLLEKILKLNKIYQFIYHQLIKI